MRTSMMHSTSSPVSNLSSPVGVEDGAETVTCTTCDVTTQARRSRKPPEAQLLEHWEVHHNPGVTQ